MSTHYEKSKEALRENVKFSATIAAGVISLILAGTTFSAFGQLEFATWRFGSAVVGLAFAVFALLHIWRKLIHMLRPDLTYATQILGNDDLNDIELEKCRLEFNRQKKLLLPKIEFSFNGGKRRLRSYLELEEVCKEYFHAYAAIAEKEGAGSGAIVRAKEDWEYARSCKENIIDWLSFTRLHIRIETGLTELRQAAVFAFVGVALFAWAANPPKAKSEDPSTVVVERVAESSRAGETRRSLRVHFANESAQLSSEAFERINEVVRTLRENPELVILLSAHTDTTGGIAINKRLAEERLAAVRSRLLAEGGVAESRIYKTEAPKRNLPKVTGNEVQSDVNRVVTFVFARPSVD
jgi:flagellar motor protein MotB